MLRCPGPRCLCRRACSPRCSGWWAWYGWLWLSSTWYDTGHELDELLDAHLAQAASLLVMQRLDDLEGDNFPPPPTLHKYQTRVAIQVWHEGRLVVRSTNAPEAPFGFGEAPGLRTSVIDGEAWRVLTTPGREPDVLIHVGELESARHDILLASLRSIAWPMLLALPLLALGIWWAVRGAVRPLRQLGQAVALRRPQALQPLSAHAVPPEVAPLVAALNGLFERMADLLESERRFTADAAHELRTPIAAIRMQAQVAQGATREPERAQALAATLLGCDRAARLIEQLLQLARLEGEVARGGPVDPAGTVSADLTAAARGLMAELELQAQVRGSVLGAACARAGACANARRAAAGVAQKPHRQRLALQPGRRSGATEPGRTGARGRSPHW